MSEIEDLLADVRAEEVRRTPRRSRVALVVAGIGVVAAIAAAATMAVSATASIAEAGLASASEPSPESQVDEVVADSAGAGSLEPAAEPAASPAEAGPPPYDASTDIATIPRPPADWAADQLANAEVWLEQQGIIADCMLDQGFDFSFTPFWLFPPGYTPGLQNIDGDLGSAKGVALYGPLDQGSGADYDWRNAGCVGYAVHVTGMDDAN